MKVLITGANGFLGQYIQKKFNHENIDTLGLNGCTININLAKEIPLLESKYEFVIHAAGKAHVVPKSPKDAEDFYCVNFEGTKNLLIALEKNNNFPERFIFISTVAVYGKEEGHLIDESHPLGGASPYAKSKILAEKEIQKWGKLNCVNITILRLPLLVGNHPPGNLGSMIKAMQRGYYFSIGDGNNRRSMVLAEDVAKLVASNSLKPGIYNLTDGYHPTYRELEKHIASQLGKTVKSIPKIVVKVACSMGDFIKFIPINSYKFEKLTSTLTFSDTMARTYFNWKPSVVTETFKLEDK
jgi:nucleoside-diphosphate-sugar epimerase